MKHEYTNTQLQAAIDGACLETHREHRGRVGSNLVIDTDDMPSVYAAEASARLDLIKSALAALPEPEPSLSKLRPLSEAAEPADLYAELKKAHAAGKVIQINCCTVEQPHWVDLPSPAFFGKPHEYRIKPEPSTFEPTPEPMLTKPISLPLAECLSLRDWFAGQALAMLADPDFNHSPEDTARLVYRIADAILKAREVKP